MAPMKGYLVSFYLHLSRRPLHQIGAALSRISYGLWLLVFYLQALPVSRFVWGSEGVISADEFGRHLALTGDFSLLSYSASSWWLNILLTLAIIAAIFVTIGLFTRPSMVVSCILMLSFHARNPYILEAGDNIGRIAFIMLLFMNCSSLSLDGRLGRQMRKRAVQNTLHNIMLYALTIQFSILYLSAALNKINGPLWQNGTAIYYVMKIERYSNPWIGPLMLRNYLFITVETYATIALQLSFMYLVWTKFRVLIVGALILMHVGIAISMGLIHFSQAMISGLLLFIPDQTYRRWGRSLRQDLLWLAQKVLPAKLPRYNPGSNPP